MSSYLDRLVSERALFALSALFIVYATTIPFDFAHAPTLARAELIPFWDATRGRIGSIPDMVQNVVLFMPYGFFAVRSFSWMRGSIIRATLLGGLLGFGLSLTVEILQTMSSVRTPSASDLATNTTGAAVGGLIAHMWGAHFLDWLKDRVERIRQIQPGLLVVLGLLAILTFGMLAPFIPTLDVGAMRAQVRSILDHPFGIRPFGASVPAMVLFAGLGFAMAHEVPSRIKRGLAISSVTAGAIGAAIMVVLAVGFEVAQMPLIHHRPSLLDMGLDAVGGVFGALLVTALYKGGTLTPDRGLGTWTTRWPAVVLTFAVLAPVTRGLSPFVFRPLGPSLQALDLTYLVPFLHFFDTLRLNTFINVFEAASTYLPLGYALAVRRVGPGPAFAIAVVLAEVLELSQIVVLDRSVDVTEGLLAAAGAIAGRAVALRLRAVPGVGGASADVDVTRPIGQTSRR